MLAPAAGLATAATWGAGDFCGGIAARRQPIFVVVFLAQLVGLVGLGALVLVLGEPVPARRELLWGGAAGLAGAVGVTGLYASLAMGRMGIAAPMTGVLAAVIPVAYAWYAVRAPTPIGISGVLLAFAGIALVSGPRAERPAGRVLWLATMSGFGFAAYLLMMGIAQVSSLLWFLLAARIASTAALLPLALAARGGWGRPHWSVLGAGVGDVLGNAFYIVATQHGPLDDAVVLSALYPVATVVLARIVLKEHLTRTQAWGAALMLGAIPLVALG